MVSQPICPCLFYLEIQGIFALLKSFFSGVAAGSVAIFFTSEWIGKNLLQFVPIYNRLIEHCWKQTLFFQRIFPPQEVHQLQGEGHVKILKIACDEQ